MSFFDEKWLLWGSRWLLGPGLEPKRQKGAFAGHSATYFGGHFGTFSIFLAGAFLGYFLRGFLFVTLGDFGAQRWLKGRFWEVILETF